MDGVAVGVALGNFAEAPPGARAETPLQRALRLRYEFNQARLALIRATAQQQFWDRCKAVLPPEQFEAICAEVNQEVADLSDRLISEVLGVSAQVFLRELADASGFSDVLEAGVTASARTLNEGIVQHTAATEDEDLRRKHRARLREALHGMADAVPPFLTEAGSE